MALKAITVVLLALAITLSEGKIFERCELARTLRGLGFPENQLGTWLCICEHESNYDTAAVNTQSGDHGIFQISELYWCSNSGSPGKECGATCAQFENDDISDDAACARKCWDETQGISGDGFTAWTTYQFCKGDQSGYVNGC